MDTTAFSIDGRSFSFETPISNAMPIGSYQRVAPDDGRLFLGQILDASLEPIPPHERREGGSVRRVVGSGSLLARLDDGESVGPAGFDSAAIEPAEPTDVSGHLEASRGPAAGIVLGEIQGMPQAPAVLSAAGFGRHTFLCGQSGSGKTYTLGVVLERLLLETDIRIVVADPNSDFVNIRSLRPAAETGLTDAEHRAVSERFASLASRIHVAGGSESGTPLRAWYSDFTFEQQTTVLGLDPFADPDEFNAFVRTIRGIEGERYSLRDVLREISYSFDDATRRLGLRIENLGVAELSIWADSENPPTRDVMSADWRMLVVDLGSLPTYRGGSIAITALLGNLWGQRYSREPIMIVIDEAHNVCPQRPSEPNQALATERVVKIAGEGRKYGLYLLLASQRPEKVHQNVLSQCDNLILMRMNSAADIQALSETFSYAPPSLVAQSARFRLGEGLAAGKIAPDPLLFRTGRRYTEEGGSDVPATWARGG
jgi:DNA helicase HerA-like ATPase